MELGREPSLAEIADACELDAAQVQFLLDAARDTQSLDAPVGTEEEFTLADAIPSQMPQPEEELEIVWLAESLRQVLEELDPRQREVIELRFGLKDVGELPSMEEFEKLVAESFQHELTPADATPVAAGQSEAQAETGVAVSHGSSDESDSAA